MEGTATGTRTGVLALAVTVASVAVVFLVAVSPWATDGFGYSLDGLNGSVWGLGARAAADDPIGSRLGGIQPDGARYANHPPLTVWTAAVGSALGGDRPGAVRAPALAASVLALAVLALLLRDAGLRWEAAAAGVVLAGTSGMFLTYGAMLDTPVVALPFGLAALAAAQRVWQARPPPTPVLVLVGALAVLSGWQAALAVGLAAAMALLAPPRPGAGASARRGAAALVAGAGVGAAVTVAWIGWVYGGLGPLFDKAGLRTGQDGVGTDAGWATAMRRHLTDLYGPTPVLLALAAAVAAAVVVPLGRPAPTAAPTGADGGTAGGEGGHGGPRAEGRGIGRWRPAGVQPVAAVLVVTVAGYTLLFRNGAAVHDYWTYWGVALVGLAGAAAVELALARTPLHHLPRGATALVVAAAVLPLAVVGVERQTTAETRIREGLDLLPVLGRVPEADDPRAVAVAVHGAHGDLRWADHLLHGRAVAADDLPALRRLPPELPVLVVLGGPPSPHLRAVAITHNRRFALVPASALVEHLGG